ncbi:hypothetical protein [Xanthomonas phage Suba]|uniref:Uncharacterized protein n=1 Tax=Xanthomonas phage Suba TaxID=2674975 RepID=A0A679KLD4_9CAUD|nr:hypothetical protein QAY88_gp16 [Xanthomonas phage Suba]CAA2409771.1 hypothetical protein [Xanthomonas phage Suba]
MGKPAKFYFATFFCVRCVIDFTDVTVAYNFKSSAQIQIGYAVNSYLRGIENARKKTFFQRIAKPPN